MSLKKPENFSSFSATYFKLWEKCQFINQLSLLLQNYLQSEWKQHCKVANFRDEVLVIAVENGALATQLRFQTPAILSFFQQHQVHLKKIEFIIDETLWKKEQNNPNTQKLKLSSSSKSVFKSVAKTLKNERLKKAINDFSK